MSLVFNSSELAMQIAVQPCPVYNPTVKNVKNGRTFHPLVLLLSL